MAGNVGLQILRGSTSYDPSTSTEVLLDGQPFYSKKTKELFIGDGVTQLKSLPGLGYLPLSGGTMKGQSSVKIPYGYYGTTYTGKDIEIQDNYYIHKISSSNTYYKYVWDQGWGEVTLAPTFQAGARLQIKYPNESGTLALTSDIPSISVNQELSTGIKIGSITIGSTITDLYAPELENIEIPDINYPVTSVAGKTGAVTLDTLTIQGNGTSIDTYNGSTAKIINITPTSIGAPTLADTIKSLSIDGRTITYTKGDGTTGTLTTQDTTQSLSSLGIAATATELNQVSGVTSNIQTQLNGKLSTTGDGSSLTNLNANSLTTGTVSRSLLPYATSNGRGAVRIEVKNGDLYIYTS